MKWKNWKGVPIADTEFDRWATEAVMYLAFNPEKEYTYSLSGNRFLFAHRDYDGEVELFDLELKAISRLNNAEVNEVITDPLIFSLLIKTLNELLEEQKETPKKETPKLVVTIAEEFWVQPSDSFRFMDHYTVRHDWGTHEWFCTCQGFRTHKTNCKHIEALQRGLRIKDDPNVLYKSDGTTVKKHERLLSFVTRTKWGTLY